MGSRAQDEGNLSSPTPPCDRLDRLQASKRQGYFDYEVRCAAACVGGGGCVHLAACSWPPSAHSLALLPAGLRLLGNLGPQAVVQCVYWVREGTLRKAAATAGPASSQGCRPTTGTACPQHMRGDVVALADHLPALTPTRRMRKRLAT